MRFAICFIAAFAVSAYALPGHYVVKDGRVFEDIIVSAAECIRSLLVSGLPDYGIPSFNPLHLDEVTADLDSLDIDSVSGYLTVTDFDLSGITDFILSNEQGTIGLIPPRYEIALTLTFPSLICSTNFDSNIEYNDFNSYGTGTLSFDAVNFVTDVTAVVTILSGIQLSDFNLWVSLQDLNSFEITGLYDDAEYSEYVSNLFLSDPSGVVAQYSDIVNTLVKGLVLSIGNDALGDDSGLLNELISTCIDL